MKEEKLKRTQNNNRMIHKYKSISNSQSKKKVSHQELVPKCFIVNLLFRTAHWWNPAKEGEHLEHPVWCS